MNPDVSLQVIARQLIIANKLKIAELELDSISFEFADRDINIDEFNKQIQEDEKRVRD